MPETAQQSAPTDVTTRPAPVVHLTRRERIAAERAAAAGAVQSTGTAVGAAVAARFADPETPTTPAAPASPVLPASSAAPVTPPAPASPIVAAAAEEFDELVGIRNTGAPQEREIAPVTRTVPVVLPSEVAPALSAPAPSRRRDARAEREAARTATRRGRSNRVQVVQRSVTTATPSRGRRGASFRKNASRATAVGAVLFTAGLVVSTSLPAQALWTAQDASTVDVTAASAARAQTIRVGDGAAGSGTGRDAYTVSDLAQYQNTDTSTFTNDPNGTIQWPFLTGVPITSGFGGRNVAGCSFCSTNHMGVDFAPGEGTPIRVVAAGTVIKVQADDGGFGNDVWVQHDVDGKQFVSVYGHMEDNSFQVSEGQQIKVGDVLGKVGSTGNSTGPHLHLEIHVNDVPVDPLTWLQANAN